ncbi:MAG: V-type ATP synthase subunit H [Myxococcota bacterium]
MRRSNRPSAPKEGGEPTPASPIDRVLRAEQEADEQVRQAEREGEERVAEARSRARHILERADRRITGLRKLGREMAAQAIRGVAEREQSETERLERWQRDPERQRAAVERVARWLIGAGEGRREG